MKTSLHNMVGIPEGRTVGDILPAFSEVKHEIHIGEPNRECAGCRKPFSLVRKPRNTIRIYDPEIWAPVCCSYRVCGACMAMYGRGGAEREAVLAAVEGFHEGTAQEASQ